MSDTEEEGAFDKEAEKEKLREQLAREEEDRRSTQHMSELLLKGATMTNKHCDACGDPLFRYEGQEFCPTCSQQGGGQEGGGQEGRPSAADATGGEAATGPAGGESVEGADRRSDQAAGGTAKGSTGAERVETGAPAGAAESGAAGAGGAVPPGATGPGAAAPTAAGSAGGVGEDVAGARASLARKLSTLARQAEATDDVGRSRELLAAAREAAEALAAIDRVDG